MYIFKTGNNIVRHYFALSFEHFLFYVVGLNNSTAVRRVFCSPWSSRFMESQDFIGLMRMVIVNFCGRFIRMITAHHLDSHITTRHIAASPDFRLFGQLIVRIKDGGIFFRTGDDRFQFLGIRKIAYIQCFRFDVGIFEIPGPGIVMFPRQRIRLPQLMFGSSSFTRG